MSALPDYQGKYPNIAFERREGVLQIALHQDGDEFVVSEPALRDLGKAFVDVAEDSANRVVILTGTGNRFATRFDYGTRPTLSTGSRPETACTSSGPPFSG